MIADVDVDASAVLCWNNHEIVSNNILFSCFLLEVFLETRREWRRREEKRRGEERVCAMSVLKVIIYSLSV